MERVLRGAVIVLGGVASIVHFYLAVSSFMTSHKVDALTALWLLNAVGYLFLLASYLGAIPILRGEDGIGFGLVVYAIITMIAWWSIERPPSRLGWFTAGDETLLVISLLVHMRIRPRVVREYDSL
jgi:hypothetical protein